MMTKRDFMKHAARTLLLGGLGALTYRQATSKKQSDICTDKNGYCRKRPSLAFCGHPNARSFARTRMDIAANVRHCRSAAIPMHVRSRRASNDSAGIT